eukprot:7202536-Ditylum_brightwellii.AAC.1
MPQPHLIQQIIDTVGLLPNAKHRQTPAPSSCILYRDPQALPFKHHFHYLQVVGQLNFLLKGTCPEIEYATHQIA